MILEYYRPESLDGALQLLARPDPLTYPMGGGTKLNHPSNRLYAVVDLQALASNPETRLGEIERRGNSFVIGAAVTLKNLMSVPGLPSDLYRVIRIEKGKNLRQISTLAGTLVSADGRSSLTASLLAMDAMLTIICHSESERNISLGEFLLLRDDLLPGKMIRTIQLPDNINLCFHAISRTPADVPMVLAAGCVWPSGRMRIVLGGFGHAPKLAFDGPGDVGILTAARDAYQNAGDSWASAEYRSAMAALLAGRCLEHMNDGG
jgi:CO/xanthine dehydrogenase FAD-binding subunit